MAYFLRLVLKRIAYVIAALLVTLLIASLNKVFAETIPKPPAGVTVTLGTNAGYTSSSVASIASAYLADKPSTVNGNDRTYQLLSVVECVTTTPVIGAVCGSLSVRTFSNGSFLADETRNLNIASITPSQCPQGYTDNGTTCSIEQATDCDAPYRNLTGQGTTGTGAMPSSVCVAGCSYPVKSGETGCKSGVCKFHTNLGTASGACGAGASESDSKGADELNDEEKCLANGQGHITTNGITACVGVGTPNGGDVTITNPSNGAGGTPSNPTFNEDGSVDSDGDGEPDKSKSEYCKDHAQEAQCNGTFYGSCSAGFTCTGDAGQCALAKETFKRNCELFDKVTPQTAEGVAMLNHNDYGLVNNPANVANRELINLSGSINEGSNIGSGEFVDKEIPLAGGGITLPFSKLNFVMQILGGFILAAAYLNAARIVGVRS